VVGISTKDTEEDIASLTSSGEESAFAANTGVPPTSKTRSGKQYLKQYSEPMVDSPQAAQETIEQSTRPSMEKQKRLRYVKALQKSCVGPSTLFRFDVMAQLANIPARITLYKLLRLSKSTRDALREALADAEVLMTQIPAICGEEEGNHCYNTSKKFPCITFTPEDMQVKEKHDRPLYYTGYIGSSEVSRIQVDPRSALSIMPCKVM